MALKHRPFNSGKFTEAAFFGWLRTVLRRASLRWKPRNDAINAARREAETPGRHKFEYQCALCQQWYVRKQVEADHIVPVGSLKSFADLPGFVSRLFVEADGWQCVCTKCHKGKTYAQTQKGLESRR